MVARYPEVWGGGDSSVDVDKTAVTDGVGFRGGPVQPPRAVVDMRAVRGNGGLLDQILALGSQGH